MTDEARAICRRCGVVLNDCEPMNKRPEFVHPVSNDPCANDGHVTGGYDGEHVPFARKRDRRASKRGAKLAAKATRRALALRAAREADALTATPQGDEPGGGR